MFSVYLNKNQIRKIHIKVLSYSLDFALSNKYFEAIIHCLEIEISTRKLKFCSISFLVYRIKSQLSQLLDSVWLFSNINLIEKSPGYKKLSLFALLQALMKC